MINKDLEKYITRCFADNRDFATGFLDMFKEYSKTEINSFEDYENAPNNFWSFLQSRLSQVKEYFPKANKETLLRRGELYKNILENNNKSSHQLYVDTVNKASSNKDIHVLDVGPGNMAYSSVLLGRDYAEVSAMDREFRVSDIALKKLNVNAREEFFKKSTNIKKYDMVVGCMPCGAIDKIVYLCAKNNKPYLIKTCTCEMPTTAEFYKRWGIAKELSEHSTNNTKHDVRTVVNGDWFGWGDMLVELDPNMHCFGNYVYNVEDNEGVTKFLKERDNKLQSKVPKISFGNVVGRIEVVETSLSKEPWIADDEKEID